jgi:hypothetical protein
MSHRYGNKVLIKEGNLVPAYNSAVFTIVYIVNIFDSK